MKITLKKDQTVEQEFWKYYLHLNNARENTLTKKELEVMVEVLSGDPYKSNFLGKEKKLLLKRLNYTSKYADDIISKIKKRLIKKGFLVETKVTRGDILVSQPLRSFQLKVKENLAKGENLSINLEFNFEKV